MKIFILRHIRYKIVASKEYAHKHITKDFLTCFPVRIIVPCYDQNI